MGNARRMGGRHPVGNLNRDVEQLAHGKRSALDAAAQQLAVHQFTNEIDDAILFADIEQRNDVGMIERGYGAGLTFEAGAAVGDLSYVGVEDLECDIATQTGVVGAVNLALS